ncbi:M10 family metallopeptidase C-terminal domain-containing protein [Pararhizobium sp. BT-229]|uniref:M10 family metallopeptidase C-terminal domain-containing protein n=1 Tax=Pararhizobium sp. BT-229 TaxID=2986923 RepID=UPI0021F7FB80|nr:M10 family metallopeptidase C-terminal domain-containing protein [Pararhizobium sp. BT-229]MCV9963354.1 M10 family metallopeptidase C-terminal domain-containing protein [Pararhizobium sp. BT-229]
MARIVGINETSETLTGGSSGDTLVGGAGENLLYGKGGADRFEASTRLADYKYSVDTIADFQQGADKIDVSAFGISSFDQLKLILETKNGTDAFFNAYYFGYKHSIQINGITASKLTTADFIFDTRGAKTEVGTTRDDRLFGTTAADTLSGGDGSDQLFGGSGNDILVGGSDTNLLYGQGGSDTFRTIERLDDYEFSADTIGDFQIGSDKIDVSAYGISSFDQLKLILETKNGTDAFFNAYYFGYNHSIQINGITASKLTAGDFIYDTQGAKTEAGTARDDRLFGSTQADTLSGLDGGDQLFGGGGNDILVGGSDTNLLYGQGGADTFRTIERADDYEFSADTIGDFQVGADKIDVSAFGISSFDQLKLILETKNGTDAFFNAYYFGYNHSIQLSKVAVSKLTAGDFIYDTQGAKDEVGTARDDRLFGSTQADTLTGLDGSDQLFGGRGNDTLVGGSDTNLLYGQGGSDTFRTIERAADYEFSADTIGDFQVGSDKIDVSAFGISSFDQLQLILETKNGTDAFFNAYYFGYNHSIQLSKVAKSQLTASDFIFDTQGAKDEVGTTRDDRLFGSRQADTLDGGAGDDQLFGGLGNDRLIGGEGYDRFFGGSGTDTAVFTGNKSDYVITRLANGSVRVGDDLLFNVEKIEFADTTISTPQNLAPSAPVLSKASVAENSPIGTTIGVFSSKDPEGGALTYRLTDSAGGLFKLSGNKLLVGKAIDYEKLQKDTITIEVTDLAGKKTLKTFAISITDVIETITGTPAAQTLKGDIGADRIVAGAGNDTLIGYEGDDRLYGDAGDDTIYGGLGADGLVGGTGKDVFLYKTLSDSSVSSTGRDTIFDFAGAEGDRIHLSTLDANTKLSGDQAFSFLGTGAFTGKAGELRYTKTASDTYVYADTNGDAVADFAIHLGDAVTLGKGYFVL